MNWNFILCVLVVGLVAIQLYDWWSTIKILKGPDGNLGTRDDGIEKMKLMLWLMGKIGVVPAITIKAIAFSSLYITVGYLGWVQYCGPAWIHGGALLAIVGHLVIFWRCNFKHDGI